VKFTEKCLKQIADKASSSKMKTIQNAHFHLQNISFFDCPMRSEVMMLFALWRARLHTEQPKGEGEPMETVRFALVFD